MPSEVSLEELQEIVKRAQEGSLEAYYDLYSLYSKPVFNFIRRLTGSVEEAEDLTQETFLKVYGELGNLRDSGQFKYWLYKIARNEVYQKLRKDRKKCEVSIDNEDILYYDFLSDESKGLDPERNILSKELNGVVMSALQSIKPKYRDVFILAVFEGMSYEAISHIVDRSLLSVKTDIYRARLAVKDALRAYWESKS